MAYVEPNLRNATAHVNGGH